MHVWQLQEAKAKLTQLIKDAKQEPQIISRHGVNETIVMSVEHYESLIGEKESFFSYFRKSPLMGLNLEFERDKSLPRDVDFFDDKED